MQTNVRLWTFFRILCGVCTGQQQLLLLLSAHCYRLVIKCIFCCSNMNALKIVISKPIFVTESFRYIKLLIIFLYSSKTFRGVKMAIFLCFSTTTTASCREINEFPEVFFYCFLVIFLSPSA